MPAIVIILALATALRFWGIRFGFPEYTRPDEQYFVNAIARFDRANTLDPDWFYYPSLYMYINLGVWRAYTFHQLLAGNYTVPDLRSRPPYDGLDQIRARAPEMQFLLGRCVTALFGVATVALIYCMTRRRYGRKAAVAAGFLLAVNGLHTLNSHFHKSDVATTFFTFAAIACMARYVEASRRASQVPHDRGQGSPATARWNVGAAVCTGLATSTNYYGGFLIVPLLLSQFLACADGASERPHRAVPRTPKGTNRRDAESAERRFAQRPLRLGGGIIFLPSLRALSRWQTYVMPLLALAAFAATSPYCFIRWADFLNAFHRMLFTDRQSLYQTLVTKIQFDDYGFQTSTLGYSIMFCYRYSMGAVLSVVGLVGLVGLALLAVRGRVLGWLLLSFFVAHFLVTVSGKAVFMRYFLSLVPPLAVGVGALLSWGTQKTAPDRPYRQILLLAGALVTLGIGSFWTSVRQDRLLAREDTRVEARRWLEKNLRSGTIVGVPADWTTQVQDARDKTIKDRDEFYPYGKPRLPRGGLYVAVRPETVRDVGVRYLLVDDSLLRLYSPPNRPEWSRWLPENARLLFEVLPYDRAVENISARYDQMDAFYVPVAGFAGIVRPGPRIRIYEVISAAP
ncbi:phospholipid carrier-dependent glycosyltransferase [Candidatus Sumerlaeota bacterium]|nr:phospholipid carrier-dependent glycosyltransferase [Candidatus Sumerlaeota bacterium]